MPNEWPTRNIQAEQEPLNVRASIANALTSIEEAIDFLQEAQQSTMVSDGTRIAVFKWRLSLIHMGAEMRSDPTRLPPGYKAKKEGDS